MSQLQPSSSIKNARAFCKSKLDELGVQSSGIDADLLMCAALDVNRIYLYAHPEQAISDAQHKRLTSLLRRRLQGEPMAYILGKKEFFGRDYIVTPQVLIPRPETELLVETSLKYLEATEDAKVLEVGSGSGCIAISLSLEHPKAYVESWDISNDALQVAKKNQDRLGAKVSFKKKDALEPSSWVCQPKFDILVSNPPYIAQSESQDIESGVKDFEPHTALFAAEDGLAFYKTFAKKAGAVLKPNGIGIFEIGYSQADKITEIFKMLGWDVISVIKDYMGKQRLVVVSYSGKN